MAKKKINFLLILFTSILALAPFSLLLWKFPAVKATYVEGQINVDTVWTLAESPFIVSQNVTICRGVTLTIEPGVEVRFGGGPFAIIVDGTLIARGTEEKPIKFTSNKESPKVGDWLTIYFNGAGQSPSFLENCIIEYGVVGLTVQDGVLTVQKSVIQFNAESGITLLGGSTTVSQNRIQNNFDGVVIEGGSTTLQNNIITLNENGVTLRGNISANSQINIIQNNISSNSNSGISLSMEKSSGNILISGNTVFLSKYGLYVATNATTFITRNYIHTNDVGALYEQGNHTIRFNDIYDNKMGMDASDKAKVNATQNYWGHFTGPYHESLNPRGKGNPVGGNGVNIDFIFFLTAPIDHQNSPPIAVLCADKTTVAPGQEVTFIGAYSYDDGRIDKYFFDFGDGRTSGWTTLSIFFHKYSSAGTYVARLTVMDDFGNVSTSSPVTIQVVNLPSLNVELSLSRHIIHRGGEVSITVRVSSNGGPVEGANVALYSVRGGSFSQQSGLTNSSGFFTTTFTAPDVVDVTNVRIIAKASMQGYADDSSFDYLEVIPPLSVDVAATPSTVISEDPSTITVRVTWSGMPIQGATVNVSSNAGGTFAETEKLTDSTGGATFTFSTPPVSNETHVTIVVHASKAGYMDGEGQTVLLVIPKILSLTVRAERYTVVSEEEISIVVNTRYGESPVKDVNITVSADAGVWSSTNGVTDAYGNSTFLFKAPPVPTETNINLTVVASKQGYARAINNTLLTVKPGNLTVIVFASSYWVKSEEMVRITVYVKCLDKPIANANVTVSADMGTFSENSALTNSSGCYEFLFWTPKISDTASITIVVNAEKYGYLGASQSVFLTVSAAAEAGGIPWLVILLVLIPVILVIAFVVLVKTGVVSVSFGEEEEE